MPGRILYPSVFNPPWPLPPIPQGWNSVYQERLRPSTIPQQPQGALLVPGVFTTTNTTFGATTLFPTTTSRTVPKQPQGEILPPGVFTTTNTTYGGSALFPATASRLVPLQLQGEILVPGIFTTTNTTYGATTLFPVTTSRLIPAQPQGETLTPGIFTTTNTTFGWDIPYTPQQNKLANRQQSLDNQVFGPVSLLAPLFGWVIQAPEMPTVQKYVIVTNTLYVGAQAASTTTGTGVLSGTANGDGTATIHISAGTNGSVEIWASSLVSGDSGTDWAHLGNIIVSGGIGSATYTLADGTYLFAGLMGGSPYGNLVRLSLFTPGNGADSAIKAIQNFYLTLDASAFPNGVKPAMYLDEAPASKGSGLSVVPPYLILQDGGEEPLSDDTRNPWAIGLVKTVWEGTFTIKSYYKNLGEADACIKAIMWNGHNPALKQGLAFCTLLLNDPLESFAFNCIPGRNFRRYAGYAIDNERIHYVQQDFTRRLYQDPQDDT